MKSLFAAGLGMVFVVSLSAQFPSVGALGGPYASRGISHPLGGISPSSTFQFGQNRGVRGRSATRGVYGYGGFPYAYSVYVPGYFDALSDQGYYPPVAVPPPPPAAGNPPVIINQYFGAPDSGQGFVPVDPNGNPLYPPSSPQPPAATGASAPAQPGDVIGTPQNYYLIAYKDHSVYAAIAYWLEDNTLNYVTTQNTHNQASLNLIDLDLTKSLNQARSVPFSLPGK